MKELSKSLSITTRGIRHKMAVSFALTSIIPILVLIYIFVYGKSRPIKIWDVGSLSFIVVMLITWGIGLLRKVIEPIVQLAANAEHLLNGKPVKKLQIEGDDEIGSLGKSLTRISDKLKENMSELHLYGEKIKQINMEINTKMLALSSLLQIGNAITGGNTLDEILTLIVEKLAQIKPTQQAFILLRDKAGKEIVLRAHSDKAGKDVKIKEGEGLLGKIIETTQALYVDKEKKTLFMDEMLTKLLPRQNIAVLPIAVSGSIIGILGVGNDEMDFIFTSEEIEMLGIFLKQTAIAVENDLLVHLTKELPVKDAYTGLYNESYIRNRLEEEIKRAVSYQRPCSFIVFQFESGNKDCPLPETVFTDKILKKTAAILKTNTTEIDKAAQFGRCCFAIVAPERNKRQAFNLTENIRKEIEKEILQQNNLIASCGSLKLSAGISAAPIDGATPHELIDKAFKYVRKNKDETVEEGVSRSHARESGHPEQTSPDCPVKPDNDN